MIGIFRVIEIMILKYFVLDSILLWRAIISNDNDISQDDDSINEEQTFIRRDDINSTIYKDRKGRSCVLCK